MNPTSTVQRDTPKPVLSSLHAFFNLHVQTSLYPLFFGTTKFDNFRLLSTVTAAATTGSDSSGFNWVMARLKPPTSNCEHRRSEVWNL